ncbi:MAG: hypothetical protein ACRDJ9_00545, partial [Dehalococcoidia bacterium]
EIMPEFKEQEEERQKRKMDELAPYVEAAFKRKQFMQELTDGEVPVYEAYGNTVALTDEDLAKLPEANRNRALAMRRLREIVSTM